MENPMDRQIISDMLANGEATIDLLQKLLLRVQAAEREIQSLNHCIDGLQQQINEMKQ